MTQKSIFGKVICTGIMGAIIGIVAGLILGTLIWGLEALIVKIQIGDVSAYAGHGIPPLEFLTMLGMGFGAIIGSIGGAFSAITEAKHGKK